MIRILIYAVIIYLISVGIFFVIQRHYIYFPTKGNISPASWGIKNTKLIKIVTSDGVTLNAWYHQASKSTLPTIVYFHGNYGHIGHRARIIRPYIMSGYGFLLLSYRGYDGSEGKPSEQGLYKDGRAALHYLISKGIHPRCMVLYGNSLGSGVAVQMATEFPVGALILQSSFTSMVDVGKHHYFILPVNLLLKDRYHSYDKIAQVSTPILFIHGEKDYIIPLRLARRLFAKANYPKQLHVYPGVHHNNMPDSSVIVMKFLQRFHICQPRVFYRVSRPLFA